MIVGRQGAMAYSELISEMENTIGNAHTAQNMPTLAGDGPKS
jgi:hypothetical protein